MDIIWGFRYILAIFAFTIVVIVAMIISYKIWRLKFDAYMGMSEKRIKAIDESSVGKPLSYNFRMINFYLSRKTKDK